MSSWSRSLTPLTGAEIRAQAGKRYHLLPFGGFKCGWHRRTLTRDQVRILEEKTGEAFWLPCEREIADCASSVRDGALAGLPVSELPDGVRVTFIPAVARIGTVLPGEYATVKAVARTSRSLALHHSYHVVLGALQRWKAVGIDALGALHDQQRAIRRGESGNAESLRLSYEDGWLPSWIYNHARQLYCREDDPPEVQSKCMGLIRSFRPFEIALQVMMEATGYTANSIRFAAHRRR